MKVEGLLGAEPGVAGPNAFAFCDVPKENGEEAAADVGALLKEKELVVDGLCVSSEAFVGWLKENPTEAEGAAVVFPNVPNGLGSSVLSLAEKGFDDVDAAPNPPNALCSSTLSLGAKRFDGDELPNENSEVVANGEVVFCDPPPNDNVPVEVEPLNENPLPKVSEGLLAPLDC